jgi:hypothetical protein
MTLVWLIYLSFAELSSLLPSQATSCILISEEANAENYSGDYACASMHEAIFRSARYVWIHADHDNIIAFGTVMIAIFTYVLYRSTEKLWEAGEKQFTLARQEFNATHRPKLIVRGAYLASKGERGTQARVDYDVVNIGESPATVINLRAFAYIQLTGTGFNPFWSAPPVEPPRERFTVTSGEHVVVCTECPSVDWQYDDFKYSAGQVFVLGVITYIGPDKVKRITGFCRRYSRDTGAWHAEKESDYKYAY